MNEPSQDNGPLGAAQDAAQTDRGCRPVYPRLIRRIEKLSLVSHSWGSMPTGIFASAFPALLDRLVLFAPIARREPPQQSGAAGIAGLAHRDARRTSGSDSPRTYL